MFVNPHSPFASLCHNVFIYGILMKFLSNINWFIENLFVHCLHNNCWYCHQHQAFTLLKDNNRKYASFFYISFLISQINVLVKFEKITIQLKP